MGFTISTFGMVILPLTFLIHIGFKIKVYTNLINTYETERFGKITGAAKVRTNKC